MKKFISIIVGVALTLGAVALTSSCQKDIANAKSLVGTTWTASVDGTDYNIAFTSSATFDFSYIKGSLTAKASGTFIITGEKPSLAGSSIVLTITNVLDPLELFDNNTSSGTFKTDTQLVLNGTGVEVAFNKK